MLILTRKKNETIVATFGGVDMKIVVLETRQHQVKLGFDGPVEVRIWRGEIEDGKNGHDETKGV